MTLAGSQTFLVILKVTSSIHTLMQDPNDRNAVVGLLKIDHVMLGRTPSLTWTDIGAALTLLWGVGKLGAQTRWAAGLRRYSGIFRIHPVQEILEIKGLRFAALSPSISA
ncbi:hypothetical protein [Sphingobium quisquiliarum]|uniref:hypothetical protein n=1 Tax=Sphingobium quisquiliarum TaxID=538379 RepID=UPI00191BFB65|nr:hypothetical protein [Sphingobium quisquiliarum]